MRVWLVPADFATPVTQFRRGRPPSRCKGLGIADFSLFPCPAANIMTLNCICLYRHVHRGFASTTMPPEQAKLRPGNLNKILALSSALGKTWGYRDKNGKRAGMKPLGPKIKQAISRKVAKYVRHCRVYRDQPAADIILDALKGWNIAAMTAPALQRWKAKNSPYPRGWQAGTAGPVKNAPQAEISASVIHAGQPMAG